MGLTTNRDDECIKLIRPDGMQGCYLILSEEERSKGFVRPVRQSYVHIKCGGSTRMALEIAETYARNPKFYGGTYCGRCGTHFNLINYTGEDGMTRERQFKWDPDDGSFVGE